MSTLQTVLSKNKLETLVLCSSGINNVLVGYLTRGLKENTSLLQLDLSDNRIEADGAELLAQALSINKTLQELNLSDNTIGDKGAKSLAEALTINTTLKALDLTNNRIGYAGANALAQALGENNTSLQTLYFSGNDIDQEGKTALDNAVEKRSQKQYLIKKGNANPSHQNRVEDLIYSRKLFNIGEPVRQYLTDKEIGPLYYSHRASISIYNPKLVISYNMKNKKSPKKSLGRKKSTKKSLGRKKSTKKSLGRKKSTKKSLGRKKSTKKSLGRKRQQVKNNLKYV
jgi:hypothetical protein